MEKKPFQTIHNFRDVGASVNEPQKLSARRIYRSAAPDDASNEEARRLHESLGIYVLIDLRTEYPIFVESRGGNPPFVELYPNGLHTQRLLSLTRHHRPVLTYAWLAEQEKTLPLKTRASAAFWRWLNDVPSAREVVMKHKANSWDRFKAAKDALDYSKTSFKAIFEDLANPETYPVLICDQSGGGVTGLVIILILDLLGVHTERVMDDFEKSSDDIQPVLDASNEQRRKAGVGEQTAIEFPAVYVTEVLRHLEEKYGGTGSYLMSLGMEKQKLERVRQLAAESSPVVEY